MFSCSRANMKNNVSNNDIIAKKHAKIHPTQKPIVLYAWILNNYAKQNNKIFDSHMGSQSSRIAAYKLGFDFWGCELDKDYFQSGCERFNRECKGEIILPSGKIAIQQNLFD